MIETATTTQKTAFKAYIELCKIRIALVSSLSTATGYILSADHFSITVMYVSLGVFLLACGASALNQFQERDVDALMARTRNRPLPSGRIRPGNALLFSSLLLTVGLLFLFSGTDLRIVWLGLMALVWYNGVYTGLKRITAFAAVIGAVVGAIPPAIGWAAGGGMLDDSRIIILFFFFFIWQVPHFWLLLLAHGEDYRAAGLPSLTSIFRKDQLTRITFVWTVAAAVSCFLLLFSGFYRSGPIKILMLLVTVWFIWNGLQLLRVKKVDVYNLLFMKFNLYIISVLFLLTSDRLILNLFISHF